MKLTGSDLGNAYLEHLDERNGEVEVGHVTANERQREHDTNGDDSAQVDLASHGNLLARVEDGGEASEALGHQGRKAQMPCGEDNGCSNCQFLVHRSSRRSEGEMRTVFEVERVEDVLVEQNDGGRKGDPCSAPSSALFPSFFCNLHETYATYTAG